MSLLGFFKGRGPSGFGYNSSAEEVTEGLDLSGKTILITGCNSGIGHETMRVLAMRGATVVGAARSEEKAQQACDSVEGRCVPVVCELSEPASVRACAADVHDKVERLDAIICNAGIMALPKLEQKYGYEKQFFTNHVGHFLLVTELLDLLAEDGRVVMVSSDAHKMPYPGGVQFDNLSGEAGYNDWRAYGQSKLANILFARELARRFEGTERTANAIHPGVIDTNLSRHMNPLLRAGLTLAGPLGLKTVGQGAATQTYAAVHPDAGSISGEYLADCNVAQGTRRSEDMEAAARLWEVTEQILEEVAD